VALAIALSASPSYGATIFGSIDCGQWVKQHTWVHNGWLMGYLSGLNTAKAFPGYDPLQSVNSSDQLILWMDNYCQKNPMSSLVDAATHLYIELEVKAGGPK